MLVASFNELLLFLSYCDKPLLLNGCESTCNSFDILSTYLLLLPPPSKRFSFKQNTAKGYKLCAYQKGLSQDLKTKPLPLKSYLVLFAGVAGVGKWSSSLRHICNDLLISTTKLIPVDKQIARWLLYGFKLIWTILNEQTLNFLSNSPFSKLRMLTQPLLSPR